jgi:hypothetical protein
MTAQAEELKCAVVNLETILEGQKN